MDYEEFKDQYNEFKSWHNEGAWDPDMFKPMWTEMPVGDNLIKFDYKDDRVNHPSHYTSGRYEAIDVIEDAISHAPSIKDGMLQAQILKYLLRLWHKDNPCEDARKAEWYLKRLIESLKS